MTLIFGLSVTMVNVWHLNSDRVTGVPSRFGHCDFWPGERLCDGSACTRGVAAPQHEQGEGNYRATDRIDHDALTSLYLLVMYTPKRYMSNATRAA